MIKLRDFQIECIDKIKQMDKGSNGVVSLPMGSGKTVIMSSLAKEVEGRVLIVVPSVELMTQTVDKLKQICGEDVDVGSVQSKLDGVFSKICVSTRQSLANKKSTRMERMRSHGNFDIIFFDEAHQAPLQLEKIVKELSNDDCKIIGMSATPFSLEMRRVFDKIVFERSIEWMIEHHYLCEPKSFTIDTKTNLNNVKVLAGEFNQAQLEREINTDERNSLVVESYKKYALDRKSTIVFASGIKHCKDLHEAFVNAGIKASYVDSTLSTEDRDKAINDYKSSKVDVIVNCGILTTGFDFPPTSCILLARPIKSKILFLQSVGRGLRLSEDKENCLILDFKDILSKHSLINLKSIFDMDFKQGETFTEAKKRKEKEKVEQEVKEKALEEERIRQEEIVAREIELLNSNIDEAFTNTYYDWFQVNYNCYALSQESDLHYAIQKIGEEFIAYQVSTLKGDSYAEELETFSSIIDAIRFVEEEKLHNAAGGFAYRRVKWKLEFATPKQLDCIKYNRESIVTKWDAHIYFKKYSIKKNLEKVNYVA